MLIHSTDFVSREIMDFIKSKIEIPDGVIGLTLHMKSNALLRIECEYLPKKKVVENGKT